METLEQMSDESSLDLIKKLAKNIFIRNMSFDRPFEESIDAPADESE